MGKLWILLGLMLALSGCAQTQAPPAVVTSITVTTQEGDLTFASDRETSAVLNYLRILKIRGAAQVNPEYVSGEMYTFRLEFSDGTSQTLHQKADRYFCGADGQWVQIEPYSGARLARLLPRP